MERLQDIALHNGGEVPLHGRLFGQWMHHAFPRECPYPFAGGTTIAQTQAEWMAANGQEKVSLTNEEAMVEIAGDTCRLLPKGVQCSHGVLHVVQQRDVAELPWDSS